MKRLAVILAAGFLALLLALPGRADFKSQIPWVEGTWTPALAGSTTTGTYTYSVQNGRYVQIGNSVCISGQIVITAATVSAGGNLRVTGLPVPASASIANGFGTPLAVSTVTGFTLPSGNTQVLALYTNAVNQITLQNSGSNQTAANITPGQISQSASITLGGCYYIGN